MILFNEQSLIFKGFLIGKVRHRNEVSVDVLKRCLSFLSVRVFGLLSSSLLGFFFTTFRSLYPPAFPRCPLFILNSQTLKMISQVQSFLCSDKQGTPEECQMIQRPKRCEKDPIKMKTIVQKLLLIKILKNHRRNLDNWYLS